MLEDEFYVDILILETIEILPIVLQVQPNKLKTSGIDIHIPLDALLKLVLTLIQKPHNHLQDPQLPIHILRKL